MTPQTPQTLTYGRHSLADILAQTVHFGQGETLPIQAELIETISRTCHGFFTAHTPERTHGFTHDFAVQRLKIGERMPYAERLALARAAVAELYDPPGTPRLTPEQRARVIDYVTTNIEESIIDDSDLGVHYAGIAMREGYEPIACWTDGQLLKEYEQLFFRPFIEETAAA